MSNEAPSEDDGIDLDLVGDIFKAPSTVVLRGVGAIKSKKLVSELDHVEEVGGVEGKRTSLHEVGVHESRQGGRGHDGAGPCHQAEEVEDDEADLARDVQAALLEEMGLPGKSLDGADQGHEGAEDEDDGCVDVISHYCLGHTEAVGVSSSMDKVAELKEGEERHNKDDLGNGF